MDRASPSPVTTQTSRSGRADGQAGGDGRGAAVDRVHAVGVHVVREAAEQPMPETNTMFSRLHARARAGSMLDRGEDGVVAAAGAPADLLVARPSPSLVVGGSTVSVIEASLLARPCGLGPVDAEHLEDRRSRSRPPRKGMPWTLESDLASTRNSARTSRGELAEVDLGDEDLVVAAEDRRRGSPGRG